MSIPDDVKAALASACRLAATKRGHTVRQGDPAIRINDTGAVVVTLAQADPAVMDAWVSLCGAKTNTGVTTNSSTRTITFRP